jgi:hypothetical protein
MKQSFFSALIIVPADRLDFQNRVGLSGQCGRNDDQGLFSSYYFDYENKSIRMAMSLKESICTALWISFQQNL